MDNFIKCLGKGLNFHKNTTINFNGSGFVLGVSLNVPIEIVEFLPQDYIRKSNKMYLLFFSKQINSNDIDVFKVQATHNHLLKNLMYQIRIAKSNYYKREANKIKNCETRKG